MVKITTSDYSAHKETEKLLFFVATEDKPRDRFASNANYCYTIINGQKTICFIIRLVHNPPCMAMGAIYTSSSCLRIAG